MWIKNKKNLLNYMSRDKNALLVFPSEQNVKYTDNFRNIHPCCYIHG